MLVELSAKHNSSMLNRFNSESLTPLPTELCSRVMTNWGIAAGCCSSVCLKTFKACPCSGESDGHESACEKTVTMSAIWSVSSFERSSEDAPRRDDVQAAREWYWHVTDRRR